MLIGIDDDNAELKRIQAAGLRISESPHSIHALIASACSYTESRTIIYKVLENNVLEEVEDTKNASPVGRFFDLLPPKDAPKADMMLMQRLLKRMGIDLKMEKL